MPDFQYREGDTTADVIGQAIMFETGGVMGNVKDTNPFPVSATNLAATWATLANVAGSATSVTLIASNSARKGATIWNDSSAILYVKFGTTASTTSCTVKMVADAYFEVPFGYSGIITWIWASATGSARVTELIL